MVACEDSAPAALSLQNSWHEVQAQGFVGQWFEVLWPSPLALGAQALETEELHGQVPDLQHLPNLLLSLPLQHTGKIR